MSWSERLSALLTGRRRPGDSGLPPTLAPHGAFHGGYIHAPFHLHAPLRPSQIRGLLVTAIAVLVVLVVLDVATYEDGATITRVSGVGWYAEGELLASTPGFSVHASQTFTLTLTCNFICYNFNGASVSPPFQLVAFSVVNQPIQYANVTLKSPSSGFDGPLTITLGLP